MLKLHVEIHPMTDDTYAVDKLSLILIQLKVTLRSNYLWRQVKLILVKDGSSQGAAFAASSALRQVANGVRCT